MRLTGDAFASAARLSDEDPLPPEDLELPRRPALEDLYRAEAPKLLRFFTRRTGREDADDLVHESFARLADSDAARAARIERPGAYLGRIATNLLRNRARSALQRSLARHVPADDAVLAGHDPVASLEARDQLQRIDRALMRLGPKTREIFLAHRVDGHSYIEIAKRTGLSLKGVEWHMTKAIAHLDRALRAR